MSESKHTPRPWNVGERSPEDNTLAIRCTSWVPGKTSPLAYVNPQAVYADAQKANAHLIAAAPDMLYVLEQTIRYLSHPEIKKIQGQPLSGSLAICAQNVRDVIKAAKGGA